MGFWFNNFGEFERKKNRKNRLVLGFYYVPSPGTDETARSVKVFANKKVKVPTRFLFAGAPVEKVLNEISAEDSLKNLSLKKHKIGNFSVLEIEVDNDKTLIDRLPGAFQKGAYDKLARLGGFFPERKVTFSPELEKRFLNETEIELDSLEGIYDNGFLNETELRGMPWLYLDIEKPLWKHDDEKIWIKRREKILKINKKYPGEINQDRRESVVKRLEERLVIDVEGVGKVGLFEKKYDAAVSFITTVWRNCNSDGRDIRELYVLDPLEEFEREEVNGYAVKRFKTERELVDCFTERVRERKPVVASGHNEVYDITQLRFAADSSKLMFDPAVKEVKPRRDFVRNFFQRLREDLIYFDSLWMNSTFYPWLRQRSFSNLKLASDANHHGFEFAKSLTHEQLRTVELQRLNGSSVEIRKEAGRMMADYSAGDVEPVVHMMDKLPISLILQLKKAVPYCTLTEIAFHPNCVNKYHDKKHFDRARNQRYYGYAQKERENEIQIFKKRFPSLKKQMLDWAGIPVYQIQGEHKDVLEVYLPFEEWIKDSAFKWAPDFAKVYGEVNEKEKFGFLQYLKALERDMLVDYYFARREGKVFRSSSDNENQAIEINSQQFSALEKAVEKSLLDKLCGSFKYLKNHFRSVYVALNGEGRDIIRPTYGNLVTCKLHIPDAMMDEADIFLLKERSEEVREMLSPGCKKVLDSFLQNFAAFDAVEEDITKIIAPLGLTENPKEFIYLYNRHRKKQERGRAFYAKYGLSVDNLAGLIASSYKNLREEFDKNHVRVVDSKGDYLFVQSDSGFKKSNLVYVVREFPVYSFFRGGKSSDKL